MASAPGTPGERVIELRLDTRRGALVGRLQVAAFVRLRAQRRVLRRTLVQSCISREGFRSATTVETIQSWHLGKQIPADTTFANKTDARR